MQEIDLKEVRNKFAHPIIGAIGATSPSREYSSEIGEQVGMVLRSFIESHKGSIFTGGVYGVGVDVYTGVMKYCVVQAIKTGKFPEDLFFVLVPSFAPSTEGPAFFIEKSNQPQLVPYIPPGEYDVLSRFSPQGELRIVRAGKTMDDRRKYVAQIADKLVMVNGGFGTLDEALNGIENGTEVISLINSGGSATILGEMKLNRLSDENKLRLKQQRMLRSSSQLSLVHCVDSVEDIVNYLR